MANKLQNLPTLITEIVLFIKDTNAQILTIYSDFPSLIKAVNLSMLKTGNATGK